MKVTIIAPLHPLKSISPYCYFLVKALSNIMDLECITFSRTTLGLFYHGGEIDTSLPSPQLKSINQHIKINLNNPLSWLKAALVAEGDIVHLQHWKASTTIIYCFIVPILKLRGKKIVISVHNITPHAPERYFVFIDSLLNRFVFWFADAFIVHNERNKKRFEELYSTRNRPVHIIGVGLHEPLIRNKLSRRESRRYLHIPEKKKVLLNFGYIWGYKGMSVLLCALQQIADAVPDVLLVIAGTVTSGWKQCEDIIREKKLSPFLRTYLYYIPESEVDIFFSAADLVVLPYTPPFDTHGGVGALAVALHKPLLVSDIGGLSEYVRNRNAIVKPGDVDDLAKKIITILQDKELLLRLEKDSQTIAEEISWDVFAQKTLQAYQDLQGRS